MNNIIRFPIERRRASLSRDFDRGAPTITVGRVEMTETVAVEIMARALSHRMGEPEDVMIAALRTLGFSDAQMRQYGAAAWGKAKAMRRARG